MARRSNKSKAMIEMSPYVGPDTISDMNITIRKKVLDGKEIISYTLNCYGLDSIPKEYSSLDPFLNDCLIPNIKSISKKIG